MLLKHHLNKIEYFCVVIEQESILKASKKLRISQPQLSRVVIQLEDIVGKQLLIRSPKGVVATKSGLDLYNTSKQIISMIEEVETKIKTGIIQLKGKIKVGTYDSIARYFFPPFLKYLRKTQKDLLISLDTAKSSILLNKLIAKELDLIVCVDSKKNNSNIVKHKIYADSFGFYNSTTISNDFLSQIILFPDAFSSNADSSNKFSKKYKFDNIISTDNLEAVRTLAESGVGVGLLPHKVARESVLNGKLILSKRSMLRDYDLFPHDIVICHREDKIEDEFISELIRFLVSWSKN